MIKDQTIALSGLLLCALLITVMAAYSSSLVVRAFGVVGCLVVLVFVFVVGKVERR